MTKKKREQVGKKKKQNGRQVNQHRTRSKKTISNQRYEDVRNKEKKNTWKSRRAALEELCELDPSRMKFGREIHMMDWQVKKIQEEIEKTKKLPKIIAEEDDNLEEIHS